MPGFGQHKDGGTDDQNDRVGQHRSSLRAERWFSGDLPKSVKIDPVWEDVHSAFPGAFYLLLSNGLRLQYIPHR